MLKVNEIFLSVQGEGLYIGRPTVFVRLTGCNLRCTWCDTEYAFEEGEEMTVDEVLARVEEYGVKEVCITGGEPLLQDEAIGLMFRLIDRGYHIVLETNGSVNIEEVPAEEEVSIAMDIKCPSSGMVERMLFSNIELLGPGDFLKFVVADEKDYEYAMEILDTYQPECEAVFTPVGGAELKWLAERLIEDRGRDVRILPQLHKIIWGNERGK
jgi:7-carboxy-7-deazaguanine synthase